MKPLLIVAFLFIFFQVEAQKAFRFGSTVPVNISGKNLPMPFAGGINAAQVQQMDINGNGQEEMVIWDRNAGNLLVFEKNEERYLHRPIFSYYFPEDIDGFLILADFDQDGKKDLFTSSPFGIKAYKNITPLNEGVPRWEVAQDFLRLENNANLQANPQDIPAIMDIDGDGDLDVVTFNFASGDYLAYYKNTSVERNGEPGLDGFAFPVSRWGGFEFCGCDNFAFGQTCAGNPLPNIHPKDENHKIEHAGGHSILLHDFNGDGILDLLMGQDECNNLYYLANEGSSISPDFNTFSEDLPQLGTLPEFPVFHAANLLDQDLLITTISSNTSSQYDSDYSQNIYHYQQSSTPTTRAFLQEDMVDLGENSRPYFKGSASSGELIVTANSFMENKTVGKAYHLKLNAEGLTLDDSDYLNLSSLDLIDLQYQEFIAADHSPSLFVSGVEVVNFSPVRKLFWSLSMDGQGLKEITVPNVQLRGNDHLEFYSHQDENFLLLARQTGELIRYKVNLDPDPGIVLLERDYLGFSDNPANRNLNVHVVSTAHVLDLYVVDQRGILSHLPDFHNKTNPETLLLQLEETLVKTRFGRNTSITSIPSAFGENRDLLLGNTAGGLVYLEDSSLGDNPQGQEKLQMNIYPNPTHGPLTIISSATGEISLINTLGQVILEEIPIQENLTLEVYVQTLSEGIYFVQLISRSGKRLTKKVVVNKR